MEYNIFAAGASAGGVEALTRLVRSLPSTFPGTLFAVLHLPPESPSLLPHILSHAGSLPASHPDNGERIQPGHIYVAPPDHHILLEQGYIRVVCGPKENRHRPAIDPLFRSIARSYGVRAVGIVLSGMLDDGTAGLLAIKRSGGIAIVQNPDEALYPSMPQSALKHVPVDYCLSPEQIGVLLTALACEPVTRRELACPHASLEEEVRSTRMQIEASRENELADQPSLYSCPECGGVLWEIKDANLLRFRCHVGHALSAESLRTEQKEKVESLLWSVLKTLEEQASLVRRLAQQAQLRGDRQAAERFIKQEHQAEREANQLRQLLLNAPSLEEEQPETSGEEKTESEPR